MAHDHHFVPEDWRVRVRLDDAAPEAVEVDLVIAADSLRDHQPNLSPEDREKVNRQAAGGEVLDAPRHPEIRFTAKKLEPRSAPADGGTSGGTGGGSGGGADGAVEGILKGTLSLHGHERPLSVPVRATREDGGWRARGTVAFKQSDFGIHPYSGFLGTVAVHDEVKLEFDMVLMRAR